VTIAQQRRYVSCPQHFSIITKPTRVTDSSSTIIDHILTNNAIHTIIPGVIRTDLSDHYSTFCL